MTFLAPILAWAAEHAGLLAPIAIVIGLGLVAIAAVYLPTAHLRSYPVLLLAIASFLAGFLAPRGTFP